MRLGVFRRNTFDPIFASGKKKTQKSKNPSLYAQKNGWNAVNQNVNVISEW